MNQWAFVVGAYLLTLLATFGLVAWAFLSMRSEEAAAEAVKLRK